jgi:hypothetical protein
MSAKYETSLKKRTRAVKLFQDFHSSLNCLHVVRGDADALITSILLPGHIVIMRALIH